MSAGDLTVVDYLRLTPCKTFPLHHMMEVFQIGNVEVAICQECRYARNWSKGNEEERDSSDSGFMLITGFE